MATSSNSMKSDDYNETYFRSHCGSPYERSAPWYQFFGNIAAQIVNQFSPKTALDAGCAIGLLVETLRNYGVAAEGFDISKYAISQIPDHLKAYVKVDDLLNPNAVSEHYDVVICIEVVEHLSEAEASVAIDNLSRWGDTIVFSSTPEDFSEPTHINVQKPGYWIEKFAERGLIYSPELDATYISPWAMIFRRRTPALPQILRDYGDFMWEQRREVFNNRRLLDQAHQENVRLIEHFERVTNSTFTRENSIPTTLKTALRQEKDKRIKTVESYITQIEELRIQYALVKNLASSPVSMPKEGDLQLPLRKVSPAVRGKFQRISMLMRTSVNILRTQGVISFGDRLYRWLQGERRYFPSQVQNGVKEAFIQQVFPEAWKEPSIEDFTLLFIVPMPEISSKRYRVFNIQEQLRKKNIKANWMNEQDFLAMPERALRFNIVVFARVGFSPKMAPFWVEARRIGIPIVFEIDDLVFDTSMLRYIDGTALLLENELEIYLRGMKSYNEMLRCCDYFIGSTEYIASAARELGKQTYVIRNGLNDRQLELAEQALQQKQSTPEVRIGYLSGSPTHQKDFAVVVPALVRILSELPNARLVIQGFLDLAPELSGFARQIEHLKYTSWEQLVQDTARLDINLAPLEINPFTAGKSALKYFEAAIVEVPTIATSIEDFRIAIRHGETGFLVTDPEDWYTHLHTLIVDPELRMRIGKNARQDVLARYTSEVQGGHTLEVYQQILLGHGTPAETDVPSNRGIRFQESRLAHQYLDGLEGLEIGAAAHNPFGLKTKKVGLTREFDAEDFEFYKAYQIQMCGDWARIDIPASAEDIPVRDSSQDFVLSSHVWEHLANPLAALEEWCRVVRPNGYILAIVPKRDAEPTDHGRPITSIKEHIKHYELHSTHPERALATGLPMVIHYSVFSPESLRDIADWYNANHPDTQLAEVTFLETDDKVGNGHLILWQVAKTPLVVTQDQSALNSESTAISDNLSSG